MGAVENKQSFFQPISKDELDELIQFLVKSRAAITLKEISTDKKQQDLILSEVYDAEKNQLIVKMGRGKRLFSKTHLTLVCEMDKSQFFGTGTISEVESDNYHIKLESFYKLQRRNDFRVDLGKAQIYAELKCEERGHRLIDFSAGGFAAEVLSTHAGKFEIDSDHMGQVAFGFHPALDCKFKVVFRKKFTSGKKEFFKIGCEFISGGLGFQNKMSALVNECQREMILKMQEKSKN